MVPRQLETCNRAFRLVVKLVVNKKALLQSVVWSEAFSPDQLTDICAFFTKMAQYLCLLFCLDGDELIYLKHIDIVIKLKATNSHFLTFSEVPLISSTKYR